MNKAFLTFIAVIVLFGCHDEGPAPAETKIYFTGITRTDITAYVITNDTTDWTTNDIWSEKESDLFSTTHLTTCNIPYPYHIIAYPNPGNGIFSLHIDKNLAAHLDVVLVDENFNKLITTDSIIHNSIAFDAGTFGIHDTVRLYYKFVNNNCEFRGHGDIVIE